MIRLLALATLLVVPLAAQDVGPVTCTVSAADTTIACVPTPAIVETVTVTDTIPGDTVFAGWPAGALETFVGDSSASEFSFGQKNDGVFMWQLLFNGLALPDVEARADGTRGLYRFVSGDRLGYFAGYNYIAHQDLPNHDYLLAYRLHFQITQDSHGMTDSGMLELRPQGENPYPYERDFPFAVDTLFVVTKVAFFHQRQCPGGRSECVQLITEFLLPQPGDTMPSGTIQELTWYYQGAGLIAGIHPTLGHVTSLIVSSQHPKYRFAICPHVDRTTRRYVDGTERPICAL